MTSNSEVLVLEMVDLCMLHAGYDYVTHTNVMLTAKKTNAIIIKKSRWLKQEPILRNKQSQVV